MDVVQGFWERPAGNTLRWVLFVPAAIAGNFLASVLVGVYDRTPALSAERIDREEWT